MVCVLVEEFIGMSDLTVYEFEDIPWEEFCQSDDHIVPHPGGEKASELSLLGDRRKKPRCEVVGVFDKIEDRSANGNVYQEKDQDRFPILNNKRKNMLDKDSWSQTPEGVFSSPCERDSVKVVSSLASEGTRTLTNCYKSNIVDPIGSDFCATAAILHDRNAAVDSNSYNYALDHISQTDDLNFFDSSRVGKDAGAYLYYDWPEIGNFEDVDRIFRSCDSTFGLGDNNEDDLGWFSSSEAVAGSSDELKSEFKFSCPDLIRMQNNLEICGQLRINDTSCSINESNIKDTSISCKDGSRELNHNKHDTLDFSNQTSCSNRTGDLMPVQQRAECRSEARNNILVSNHSAKDGSSRTMNGHKKQLRQEDQSDGKRSDQYLTNATSICYSNNSLQNGDSMLPSDVPSCQTVSSIGIKQQKQATVHEPFSYFPSDIQSINSDYIHQSDQNSVYPVLSSLKTGNNGFTSVSSKESYSSNQALSADSSRGPPFQVTPFVPNEKGESIHHQQVFLSPFSREPENMDTRVQVPLCDPLSIEKNAQHSGTKFEVHGDSEGVPGEVGSSTVHESSSVSSVLDEISLEAASFRQLQHVMEQLDLKTKLCIRDSLYRLARSAEQRHNHENLNGSFCGDDRDTSGLAIEGANKCSGFMDIETDTNPIDRSIAHLLFHRPPDSSAVPVQDSLPCKSTPAVRSTSITMCHRFEPCFVGSF